MSSRSPRDDRPEDNYPGNDPFELGMNHNQNPNLNQEFGFPAAPSDLEIIPTMLNEQVNHGILTRQHTDANIIGQLKSNGVHRLWFSSHRNEWENLRFIIKKPSKIFLIQCIIQSVMKTIVVDISCLPQ